MKKLLLMAILISPMAKAVDLSQRDKQLHLGVSAAISGAVYTTLRLKGASRLKSAGVAALMSMWCGTVKELTDEKFDWQDMQADAIGTSIGVSLGFVF